MVMASLSPKARALIQASRRARRATPADRARIEAALRARLGPDALPPEPKAAPVAHRAGFRLAFKAAASVCVVGGALLFAVGAPTRTPKAKTRQDTAAEAVTAPSESLSERHNVVASVPTASRSEDAPAAPSAPMRRQDGLAREVALLSRAMSALNAGRAGDALRALDAHQRRFPSGLLTEERRAAKAQALCLLGRVSEGRSELHHLAPESPAKARATQVCDRAASPATRR